MSVHRGRMGRYLGHWISHMAGYPTDMGPGYPTANMGPEYPTPSTYHLPYPFPDPLLPTWTWILPTLIPWILYPSPRHRTWIPYQFPDQYWHLVVATKTHTVSSGWYASYWNIVLFIRALWYWTTQSFSKDHSYAIIRNC